MTSFILDNIQLRNVRCYGDEVMSMDFPLNNLTVFTGHVGAGKSTILKAVSMALYGEDGGAKGEKLSIDDMINEKNKKNLEIHLLFHSVNDVDNSEHKYEIHLFHKHSKYNNKLVFVKDGKDISLESKTATYELIEKTLIPKNVYHNIYYFTQQAKNFFTALPNGEQKEIFNSILDLSEYSGYYENAKNEVTKYETQCNVKRNAIESQNKNTQTLENLKDNAQKELYVLKEENKKKVEHLKSKIDETNVILENCPNINQTDIDNINQEINDVVNKRNLLESEYSNYVKNIDKTIKDLKNNFNDSVVPVLKDKFIKLKLEQSKDIDDKISKLQIEIERCKQNIEKVKSDLKIKRVEQLNSLEKEYNETINKTQNEINDLNSKIYKKNEERIQKLTKIKDEAQTKVDDFKSDKKEFSDDIISCKSNICHYQEINTENLHKIKQYEDDLNKPDAVCSLCGQKLVSKDHVQKHIDSIKEDMNNISSKIVIEENEIERNNKKILDIDEQIRDLVEHFEKDRKVIEDECKCYTVDINNKIQELEKSKDDVKQFYEYKKDKITNQFFYNPDNENEKNIVKYCSELKLCDKDKNDLIESLRCNYKIEYTKLSKELEDKIHNIEDELQRKTLEYKSNQKEFFEKIDNLEVNKNDLVCYKTDREDIEEALKQYKIEFDKLIDKSAFDARKKQIEEFENVVNASKETEIKLVSELKQLDKKKQILEFWKSAFSDSGIKSMLIDSAIPHMNECVTCELERVAPGIFTVSFDTLSETKSGKVKDKFNINIVNNVKGSTGHKKLSGGEKRIIDLCCMSALRSLAEKLYNKKFCHIFYDEILDSLDDECKQLFCANIKMQSTDGCNITLVTHDLPEDVDPDRTFPF